MNVLVACEFSGVVRDAFIRKGHNAISCDLLDTGSPGFHLKGDVLPLLQYDWDLIIAHPPCTYFANSGVSWLHKDESRWKKLDEAAIFFQSFIDAPCPRICIENPIPHKYALERIDEKYSQIVINEQQYSMNGKDAVLRDITVGKYDVRLSDRDVLPTMRLERLKMFTEMARNGVIPLPPMVMVQIFLELMDDPELKSMVMENIDKWKQEAAIQQQPGGPQPQMAA